MIFQYELEFVAFTWPNCLLDLSLPFIVPLGRNFVSGICKLKIKNPTNLKKSLKKHLVKNLGFRALREILCDLLENRTIIRWSEAGDCSMSFRQ